MYETSELFHSLLTTNIVRVFDFKNPLTVGHDDPRVRVGVRMEHFFDPYLHDCFLQINWSISDDVRTTLAH